MFDHVTWQSEVPVAVPPPMVPELAAAVASTDQTVARPAGRGSIVAELRNLAELYASGALTDTEFVTAKIRLLT